MSKATIQDIANLSKVSVSTVSRVLNNHPSVSRKVRERVLGIIEELDYQPSKLARSLSSNGFDAILIVYARSSRLAIDNPYFNTIVGAIGSVAEDNGFDMILQSGSNEDHEIRRTLSMIEDRFIKGILLLSSRVDDALLEALSKTDLPVGVIGKFINKNNCKNIFSVDTDNFNDANAVCRYLINIGHRKIACIHAPKSHYVSTDRVAGFVEALKSADIEVDEELFVNAGHTFDSACDAALKLLCVRQDVSAVFATDDMKALGIYSAAKKLSIPIPDRLSVIGYNDYLFSKMVTPPLTTVRVPIHDLGVVSATKLFTMIKKGEPEPNCILPTEFKIRNSHMAL